MLDQNRPGRNIELRISYAGARFHGWQKQSHCVTVQGILETILMKILKTKDLKTVGSSRTDSGVHAHDQHVSFMIENPIPIRALQRALNHRLPPEIRVLEARVRPERFSARHDARAKHYAYYIFNGESASPFIANLVWRHGLPLDEAEMARAAQYLVGERCFKALQASGDKREDSVTHVHDIRVERNGSIISFETLGHRYLYHMVRNMVGSLIRVGRREWTVEEFRQRLDSGRREEMGITAPAAGLHLIEVFYDDPPFQFSEQSREFRRYLSKCLGEL